MICEVCGAAAVELHRADPLVGLFRHVRCPACGLVWVSPRPDFAALNAPYDGPPREGRDDEARGRRADVAARRLRRLAGAGARVLDVGCGGGEVLAAARRAGLAAEGLDLSADRAAEARARSGAPVHAGPLESLPPGPPFDLIRLHQVLEHVERPRALLETAVARLAPGGRVVLATPNVDSRAHDVLGAAWRQLGHAGNGHLVLVGPASLRRLAAACGLEVERLRTRGARARSLVVPPGPRRTTWRAIEALLEPVVRVNDRGSTLEAVLRRT